MINKAIAYDCDYVDLNFATEFDGNSILRPSFVRTTRVRATTVSSLLAEANFYRIGLVCDIEGGEEGIIVREMPILGDRIKYFLVEMHPRLIGEDAVRKLMNNLVALGFTLKEQIDDSVFFARDT
jgi:hypothetical protein